MRRVRRVCVIGAGLSGLACAAAAAGAGRQVDLYEATTARANDATHVDLGPATVRELAALGLGAAVARAGFAYQGVDVLSARGERLCERSTPQLAGPRLPGAIGIREAGLLAAVEGVAVERGVRVHRGVRVATEIRGSLETPAFSEPEIDTADLVVVAAGLDPMTRGALFPEATAPERFDSHWWQAMLPRPLHLHRATWVLGTGSEKILLLPLDIEKAGVGMARPASALDECSDVASRGASMRAALAFASTALPSLGGRFDTDPLVSVRQIRAALLPPPWHRGHVLCVGESAHALPPHFGQATVQSLTDAVVLGDLLREDTAGDALPAAFSAKRAAHATRVHALVRQAVAWTRRPDAATDLPALAAAIDAVVTSET